MPLYIIRLNARTLFFYKHKIPGGSYNFI